MAQGGDAVTAFPVKCAGCGSIYDCNGNRKCPSCGTVSITPRSWWSRKDFENADRLAREEGKR
jgi:rRNA maturation endonuclease Nob1